MIPSKVTARVSAVTCALVAVLAAPAWWLGGPTAALGVLAGGVLAVVNFRWLVARAITSSAGVAGGAWLVGAGLRLTAFTAAGAGLLAFEGGHPGALLAGVSGLSRAGIVEGVRAAGAGARAWGSSSVPPSSARPGFP